MCNHWFYRFARRVTFAFWLIVWLVSLLVVAWCTRYAQ